MRILFLTDNFPPEVNAAASRVYERALYWVKWGHEVTVITSAPNFPEGKIYPGFKNKWHQKQQIQGIQVIRVKTFMAPNQGFFLRLFDFLSYMLMATIVGTWQKKPDFIIATSPQFFTAISGWMLSIIKRRPFVFELGDLWPATIRDLTKHQRNYFLELMEKVELFLYRRAKIIIALTQSFKDDLIRRNIPADKIFVVQNGAEIATYYPHEKDQHLLKKLGIQHEFIAGYIGTFGMAHGLENLLISATKLSADIKIMLVGAGAEKDKLEKIHQQLHTNNIIFLPKQEKSQIFRYWSICNVALVHLKNEPIFKTVIPSKIFEAMAMGLPIIFVGPEGEASRIIKDNQCGICVRGDDPDALANMLQDLANNSIQLAAYRQACLQAIKYFTRENQAKKMIGILSSLQNSS